MYVFWNIDFGRLSDGSHVCQVVLLNVGSISKGRLEAWRLHNRAWRLQNRGWRLQNRGLEALKSSSGASKIQPGALQDAFLKDT